MTYEQHTGTGVAITNSKGSCVQCGNEAFDFLRYGDTWIWRCRACGRSTTRRAS